ncbi:putative protein translocase subunit SecA, SecA Wing/Scaffold, secA, Wing/Scaffold superfamily [Dioscorea sansibarensis]
MWVQRKHVYDLRQLILTSGSENCCEHIFRYMQEVADEIVFANVDPLKSPRNWTLGKLLDEFVDIGGNCLAGVCQNNLAEIREDYIVSSLEKVHGLDSTIIDAFSLRGLPLPPKTFRGIHKKQSSLNCWLNICADDSMQIPKNCQSSL